MPDLDLEKFRTRLRQLQSRLTGEVTRLVEAVPEELQPPGELDMPTHNADHPAEALDREVAVIHTEQAIHDAATSALERIDQGTFGQCENCGDEISAERLDAIPYTPYCARCADKLEGVNE